MSGACSHAELIDAYVDGAVAGEVAAADATEQVLGSLMAGIGSG